MLKKRLISVLTFNDGVLFRTKKFNPDYRYTLNFVNNSQIDEIVILDITRDKKLKNSFFKIVEKFAKKCFVPISVGGGIKKLKDVKNLMNSGADKVVLNSGGFLNNNLIREISYSYGKQCLVLSVDVKKVNKNYFVHINNGRTNTKVQTMDWIKKAIKFGVGEIMLNTIENDGSLEGYNINLYKKVINSCNLPVILVGGAGNWGHFEEGLKIGASGVCTQNIFHYTETSILNAKKYLIKKKFNIRS